MLGVRCWWSLTIFQVRDATDELKNSDYAFLSKATSGNKGIRCWGNGCYVMAVTWGQKSLPMQGDLEGLTSLFLRFKSVVSPFPVSEIRWVEKANKTKDE